MLAPHATTLSTVGTPTADRRPRGILKTSTSRGCTWPSGGDPKGFAAGRQSPAASPSLAEPRAEVECAAEPRHRTRGVRGRFRAPPLASRSRHSRASVRGLDARPPCRPRPPTRNGRIARSRSAPRVWTRILSHRIRGVCRAARPKACATALSARRWELAGASRSGLSGAVSRSILPLCVATR